MLLLGACFVPFAEVHTCNGSSDVVVADDENIKVLAFE